MWAVVVLFSLLWPMVEAHSGYMILYPNTVRPGMRFDCHVVRQSKFPRLSMRVKMQGRYGDDILYGEFDIGSTYDVISLQIPDNFTESSSVYLKMVGRNKHGSKLIDRTAYLRTNTKRLSLFIQTDKGIYKPGQTVQFRVFAVNADLGVIKDTMDIDILDPSKNKIAIWRDVSAPSGVFQGEMVMSSQPPLGDWTIAVVYGANTTTKMEKKFSVKEIVLPKFEASLSTSGYGLTTDTTLTGSVNARYTFGKGVEGNGTLTIKKKDWAYKEEDKAYSLLFQIDGTYKFTIDREELFGVLGLIHTRDRLLSLRVEVTETLTGETMVDTGELQYYTRLEKLAFVNVDYYFKPGLRFTGYVLLTDPRDRPLKVDNAVINITVTLDSEMNEDIDGRVVNITAPVRQNGMATFSFKIPRAASSMSLRAAYRDTVVYTRLHQFRSSTNSYLQVTLQTRRPKSGRTARFLIRSTNPKKYVNCMIMSRGMIVHSERVYIENRRYFWKVPMTSEMAPSSRVLVFYIKKKTHEVIADGATFSLEGLFENKVNIRFRGKSSEPGQNVALVVKADPGSQCNVQAVDKSVLLVSKGNAITTNMVQEEVQKYDSVSPCTSGCNNDVFGVPMDGRDVYSLFRETGLYYLTDALMFKYYPPKISTSTSDDYDYTYDYWSSSVYMSSGGSTAEEVSSAYQTSTTTGATTPSVASSVFSSASSMSSSMEEDEPIPGGIDEPPNVRSLFPDTWIFSNSVIANSRGQCYINATVPDTITSWVATAFAVHNTSGLGVAPESANLEVFLQFFIRLELPYSVTRGEQLILQASVFNFFDTDLEVEVRLRKSQCFENILVSQADNGSTLLEFSHEDIVRQMTIPADKAITLNFPIRPVELGMCEIDIQAISPGAGDAVKRDLLVKAEGIEQNYNIPILVEVSDGQDFNTKLPFTLPNDVVPDSPNIRLAVVGDLMGPSITGLTRLLRMPYGCGEQNMLGFVPNIVVIKYLEAVNNLQPTDLENGKNNMVAGYQRELRYRHRDGSYSAFGRSDRSGSLWLTAYVVKSFAQASPYIYIDPTIMGQSIGFIVDQYNKTDGTFREPGYVFSKSMQGGGATGARNLATYTLIALMEAKKAMFTAAGDAKIMSKVIGKAISTLENSLVNMTDLYTLAIASYALALAGSDKLEGVMAVLEQTAKTDDGKYWDNYDEEAPTSWSIYYVQAHRSRNIEINAYILLTYVTIGDLTNAVDVMKWLARQRNSLGGFISTQDTVLGLQALAEVSAVVHSDEVDVQIRVQDDNNIVNHVIDVNPSNAMLFQTAHIPIFWNTTRFDISSDPSLLIEATGKGICLLQVTLIFNVKEDPIMPLFSLTPSFTDETINGFKLRVCFNWLGDDVSGMAVMEIGLLSGFTAERFSVTSLGILRRVEEGDNMLILYFDEITSDVECTNIQMKRTGLVAGSQPAIVKLYDYYDPENHVISYYQPDLLRESNVCDIGGKDIGCSA